MSDPVVEDFSIEVEELTQATVSGNGVFDVLMRAVKEHIEQEHKLGRIRGPEYATVYLGALENTMNTALQFLLQQQRAALEAEQIKAQTLLIQAQIAKTEVEKDLLTAQLPKIAAEVALAEKEVEKIDAEIVLLGLQGPKITKEIEALTTEILKTEAEITLLGLQEPKIEAETELIEAQILKVGSDKLLTDQQKANLTAEALNIPKQGQRLDAEKELLVQKKLTETAQTNGTGVTVDSVIGRQNALYQAQTEGFERDAEQKAAKIMIDTWSVRRTSDEGVPADTTNKLDDATIGKAVTSLLTGIGVTP